MRNTQLWHIIKRPSGHCEIVPSNEVAEENNPEIIKQWGPFTSENEAIATRVGLIRSGGYEGGKSADLYFQARNSKNCPRRLKSTGVRLSANFSRLVKSEHPNAF